MDLNFFLEHRKQNEKIKKYTLIVCLVFAFLFTYFYISLDNKHKKIQSDIFTIKENLNKYNIDALKTKIDNLENLKKYEEEINKINVIIQNKKTLTKQVLNGLIDIEIKDIMIEKLTINEDLISITGRGTSKTSVAVFSKKLKEIKYINSINIKNITEDNGSYKFYITCKLGDVSIE
ncbi:Fimbrial assembly protein (PilN) [Alkalithermobacter thermoalcaliphilus JW-YL-7 = DSM 7308]|uniref:Fimbrial assembly family protein n=1 Tax=Alkalithermobacter thermoalcaliphilus JW-YL-7 = DSM 7308 TaxID=1121328 RepID=A0A150FT46_CLOPD|nr:Fimbrial assembly family protein [[Clostridium] paradoxum JW-YL-7 = DSM 7308]SHK36984.1 Fimbrial assembly protein (PilN) [[Clostridium] paradoxum JW-YL-7 = DSM 7308]